MKTYSILATIALIGAPVAVHASPVSPVQLQTASDAAEANVDAKIVSFRERATAPAKDATAYKASYDELISALRGAYKSLDAVPTTEEVRKRLSDAITDIYNRGHNAAVDKLELNELRTDAMNHRIRNAVRKALAAAKAGTGTVEDARQILAIMTQAADAAKEAGADLSELRAAVQARVDELTKRAKIMAEDYEALDQQISANIALLWEQVAQRRAAVKGTPATTPATVVSFTRLKSAVSDHFTSAEKLQPDLASVHKRLQAMIQSLQDQAIAGEISAEKFQDLKAALIARVRAYLAK